MDFIIAIVEYIEVVTLRLGRHLMARSTVAWYVGANQARYLRGLGVATYVNVAR